MKTYRSIFVNNEWQPAEGQTTHSLINPTTEERYGELIQANKTDVERAVSSAAEALNDGPWSQTTLEDRCGIVRRMQLWLAENTDRLGKETSISMGMPFTSSRTLLGSVALIDMYIRSITSMRLEYLRSEPSGSTLITRRPVGVVAGICPWNTPVRAEVKKAIPALLAGCTVVLKPAPDTPFGGIALAEAALAAGLPPGVLNVVFGGGESGTALVSHPAVDKVAFTGSTATGSKIGRICGESFTRVQLELGGKSAAIVLDDADLEVVAPLLDIGNFMNSGQGCTSLTRVLAPRSRMSEVTDALVERARAHRMGDPLDEKTTMGPLVNRSQLERVLRLIAIGQEEGARLLCGGRPAAGLATGFFVEPTVFTDVHNSMTIARDEIFGPVASVIPYDGEDEAIAIANDSIYGLNGAVLSSDEEHALDVARRIRTGTVGVNRYGGALSAPFGGVKQSGVGREHGPEGFESFLEYRSYGLSAKLADSVARQGVSREVLD